jgi:hypothetical protein
MINTTSPYAKGKFVSGVAGIRREVNAITLSLCMRLLVADSVSAVPAVLFFKPMAPLLSP